MSDITGGLVWHLRALRARTGLWQTFRDDVERWLANWQPQTSSLVIIGPSAGWCLPVSFLTRFAQIHCVDIDPLASWLFQSVHGGALKPAGVTINWSRDDFFDAPARILSAYPASAVLLANVAGQRCFQLKDAQATELNLKEVRAALSGRDWASFHDRLSAPGFNVLPVREWSEQISGVQILERYGLSGEWLDHLTGDILPASVTRRIIPWRFSTGRVHLVEAGIGTIYPPS